MEIFVGNLPQDATEHELNNLFKGYKHSAFRIITKRGDNGRPFRFGLGEIRPERAAQKAIKRLNTHPLRGHRLVVREFFYRATGNERRSLNWRAKPWDGPERRGVERRLGTRTRHADEHIVVEHHPELVVNE